MATFHPEHPLPWRLRRRRHLSLPLGWPLLVLALLAMAFPVYHWYEGLRWLHVMRRPRISDYTGYMTMFPLWMRAGSRIPLTTMACCAVSLVAAEGARRRLDGISAGAATAIFVVACLLGALTLFTAM